MQRMLSRLFGATIALVMGASCAENESATNLNPEGPPMIRQVRLLERFQDPSNPNLLRTRRVFAFGTHPLAGMDEAHPVTTAVASQNTIRIVMDELLIGTRLEEIACRAQVNARGVYARVPDRSTPDDIARCAQPNDVLPRSCPPSPTAVCMCELDDGCIRGSDQIAKGQPVGVLDINQDGAVDDTRFIEGAVGLRCTTADPAQADVPIDLDNSYWNPSGDQNRPAMGGFDALGPAIVIVPTRGLPTNTQCRLTFADDVVDKSGNRVCAPEDGNIEKGCEPGDVSRFEFGVEALRALPASPQPGQTGVSLTGIITIVMNAAVDPATSQTVSISPTPPGGVTITNPMPTQIRLTPTAPFAPETEYTVTVPTTVTDTFGQGLPQALTFSFTTGS
jgi:hypothetical protein